MNFVADVLERFAASAPALVTVDAGGRRRTWPFGELIARSAGLSGAFASRGVRRGDVVACQIGNRIEWVVATLACWRMGATVLPLNGQLRRDELRPRLDAARPALGVGEAELLGALDDDAEAMELAELAAAMDEERAQHPPTAVEQLGPSEPALILFTSGTTGAPRGVVHGQRYLAGQRLQAEHWLGARPGDLVWCTAASGWSKSARNAFVAPWLGGAAALLHDARFDPRERLGLCAREGVTVLCQAPTEYRMLAARAPLEPIAGLRRMVAAGEALNPEVVRTFREAMGLDVVDGYGQTETGHITTHPPGVPVREGSMGRPLPGLQVRIVDGELQLHAPSSPTFFERYLDGERFEAEWWPTGDLVREDDDGFLYHEGRADDVIVSSGYRIGPGEVEDALLSHPAVAEAAAVPAPDAERGAVVRAVVVVGEAAEPGERLARELQEHVKRHSAPYKYPRIVEFAAALPKTASGKIRRSQLR